MVDGSDNFATRYLVNDACSLAARPLVYGALFQFEGQVAVFNTGEHCPCYRCLFPKMPLPGEVPNCAEAGVFGALCGVVGSLQALEAIKLLLGLGDSLAGRLLRLDALTMRPSVIQLMRDPACPRCAERPSITGIDPAVYQSSCSAASPADDVPKDAAAMEISVEAASAASGALFIDVREPVEWDICRIDGARLLPLSTLAGLENLPGTLPHDRPLVVYCHHGMRSLKATEWLRARGYNRAVSMHGGIDAWSRQVDPAVARY